MNLYQASPGKFHEEVIALDLPFLIPLPTGKALPVSISLGKSIVETTYQLFVSIVHGKSLTEHITFPIRIKRYDTLSTFGAFQVPISNTVSSSDHIVVLDYSIPTSSIGPTDDIIAYIVVHGNPDWKSKSKKVKIQRITMSVVEVVTFNHEGDEKIERRRKVSKVVDNVESKIPEEGYSSILALQFPQLDLRDKDGLVYKERPDIPLCVRNGCSTECSLYKIEYLLIIKARLQHAKDIEIEQPFTITPFDHATCMSFMKSISDSVNFAGLAASQYTAPQPRIHYANDASSMWQFGASKSGGQLLIS